MKRANILLEASQADLKQRTSTLEKRNLYPSDCRVYIPDSNEVKSEQELLERSAELVIETEQIGNMWIFCTRPNGRKCNFTGIQLPAQENLCRRRIQIECYSQQIYEPLIGVNTLHFKIGEWDYYVTLQHSSQICKRP